MEEKKIKHNFEDYHPARGFVNWYEDEYDWVNKKSERRKGKQEIIKQLNEIIDNQENIDPEFADIMNEDFWKIV